MEKIINNPGLQHVAENVFLNLNYEDLKKCQLINQYASQILDNPMLWIKALIQNGLSKENQNDWIEAIQSETISAKKKLIAEYLKWNFKKKNLFNLPCYTKPAIQDDFRKKIYNAAEYGYGNIKINTEIVKSLAPLTDNPNAPNNKGETPMKVARNEEIKRILKSSINSRNCNARPSSRPSKKRKF